ncbi:MAG TPA: glycosyltransferase, partial [Solirubrobacteraceae bacterium]|nr:glycosyltransferase [Solirubrobacteraceae bacterium]
GLPRPEGAVGRGGALAAARRVAAGVDAVVAISAAVAEGVGCLLGVRARVIHPGVDLQAFAPGGRRAEEPTLYCAAALDDPRKQADVLLGAFARVRRGRPQTRLLLERPADPTLAARLAGQAGVRLAPAACDDATLRERYRAAWVSVLPSRAEAFGLVLAEGLACGTPGVGTREGGIPEVVDDPGVGRLFVPGDEGDLARALLEALDLAADPATPARCRAHARAFDQRRCVAKHVALYRELGAP